jgi:hypothetical protein
MSASVPYCVVLRQYTYNYFDIMKGARLLTHPGIVFASAKGVDRRVHLHRVGPQQVKV